MSASAPGGGGGPPYATPPNASGGGGMGYPPSAAASGGGGAANGPTGYNSTASQSPLPPSSTAASLPPSAQAGAPLGGLGGASVPPSASLSASASVASSASSAVAPSAASSPLPPPSSASTPSSASSAAAQSLSSSVAAHIRTGEVLYGQMEKVNSELLAMTYGAIVTQIIKDYKDVAVVNAELEKMGYNIGIRLVDEFLCRATGVSCSNFRETASVIAKVAFKMFLGITAEVGRWRADGRQCVLSFKGNPLLDFVELPQHLSKLEYSAMIAGVIRGACQMIQMQVTVEFVKDELKGAGDSEIRLTLKEILQEEYADDEDK